ncbi:unnamed protein product [Closterium sp. NIES-53]
MAVEVWYTADQLNLWPRVSFPETSPTLRWTGKVGDASVFRVWGSRALVCDNSADKLSSRAIPCDVTFDKSVPFYRLFPYCTAPLPPPPRCSSSLQAPLRSGAAGGGAARGVASGGAEPAGAEPGVAEPASAEPGGAQPEGAEPGGAETDGAEPRGAESEGAESWAAEPRGSACAGGLAGASPQQSCRWEPLSPRQLREWFARTSGMGLMLGGRGPVVLSGHADASWFDDLATQRLSQGYTFYLGSGSISWRSTCSSSVLISSYKAEIYAGAIAAQELHWLTYLLTNLGERPRSPPVLYVDNKAMIALCQEHKLEHRMKHIALHYFLAQELQERGQLRLAYVATRATPRSWSKGATKKSSGGSDRGKGNTSNGSSKCHYCGKAGHFWHDSRESIVLLAGDGTNTPSNAWFLDIGVTQHMTHSALFLTNVGAPRDVTRVIFGNDKSLPVVGVGSTRLIVDGGPVDITNVFHGPGLKVNLLSVSQLAKKGVTFTMDDAKMNLFWKGKQFAQSVLNGELYQLKTHPRVASSNVAQGSKATLKAWHNRIAHANYFIVTRLPDSLRSVRDHFLSLDPTSLTVDILEQHLLAAETSAVADDAACGTPCTPFFEGCPPSPLAPSYAFAAAVDVLSTEDVGVASVSTKRRSSKGRGGRDGEGGSGSGGGGSSGGSGGGGSGGNGRGSGGVGGGGGGSGGSGGRGSGGSGGGRTGAQRGGSGGGQRQRQQHRSETPSPHQLQLLRSGVAIFDLDYDAILSIMYALSASAEGDYYRCVPPDTGIDAAALGASESSLPGTAPAEALHAFTLDSGASRCFFRDSTTLTPLPAPVPVRLADPSGGSIVARSSTILPCLAVPSGSLSGLHLPSFFMNLVSTAALQDAMVTTTNHGGQRVSICTCTRTGRHMATFTRRPGSSLYTLVTEPPQVAASSQVSASSQVAPPCSCRIVSHQNLLWHHCLGHPPLPRLRGMHSRLLISSLPRSLPPLPPSPALPCLSCVEGRQRAAPYSSSFPPTTAPLLTLHMDVWGPARVSGQSCERDFLLVVDDYTRYTTVFPLHSKGEVVDVLIPSIRTVRLQLRKRFGQDLPVLRLHSDRGAPHWLSHGGGSYLHDPCGRSPFSVAVCGPSYHPTSRHVFPSQDVTFDESVPFYRIFPYHSALPPPPPLFLAPGPPPVDPFPPQGPAPSGVAESEGAGYGGDEPGGEEPGGAEPAGGEPGGAKPGGVEPGGADSEGAESGGAESEGAESGGAEPLGAASSKGPTGASSRLSPQQLCEWLVRRARLRSGAPGAGAVGARGVGVTAGAGEPGGTAAAGPGGARTRGTGAARTGGVGGAVL